jgi:hypothetical protein
VRLTAPDPAQPYCSATEDALIYAPSTDEIGSPTDVVIFLDGVADPARDHPRRVLALVRLPWKAKGNFAGRMRMQCDR